MRHKPTLGMSPTQLLVAVIGLLLAVLFTTGAFGGLSISPADAQTPLAVLPCDLPPFSDGGTDTTPTCSPTPAPTETPGACADDELAFNSDFPFGLLDAAGSPGCYNLALIQTSTCTSTTLEIVGVLHDAPPTAFDGSLTLDTAVAPLE